MTGDFLQKYKQILNKIIKYQDFNKNWTLASWCIHLEKEWQIKCNNNEYWPLQPALQLGLFLFYNKLIILKCLGYYRENILHWRKIGKKKDSYKTDRLMFNFLLSYFEFSHSLPHLVSTVLLLVIDMSQKSIYSRLVSR